MALVALALGLAVYQIAQPRRAAVAAAAGVFTGGEPLSGPGRLPASDFSLIMRDGLAPFYRWFDPDRYYGAIWRALLAASSSLERASQRLEQYTIIALPVVALALAALVGLSLKAPLVRSGPAGPPLERLPLLGAGAALLALILAASAAEHTRRSIPLMIAAGLLAGAGLAIHAPLGRVLLLEGAAVLAVLVVWQTAAPQAARAYLAAVLVSAAAVLGGTLLASSAWPGLALGLLLVGYGVKLALIPLYLWLPRTAEQSPAVTIGLLVAVVDVAAFGELLALRTASPWLFEPRALWLAASLISALGGGALMLAQRDLKRLLAFSTIEDMGYLIAGVTLGGEPGLLGAALGVAVHALAKALLFASLSAVENRGPLTLDAAGLAARCPLAGAGFVVGALAMLGIPPTLGFAARWRLYSAAAAAEPLFLLAMLIASALALLAYARVIARCWWGNAADAGRRPVPAALAASLVGLSVLLLLAGLWPEAISSWLLR
jgi:hypothetical protein